MYDNQALLADDGVGPRLKHSLDSASEPIHAPAAFFENTTHYRNEKELHTHPCTGGVAIDACMTHRRRLDAGHLRFWDKDYVQCSRG